MYFIQLLLAVCRKRFTKFHIQTAKCDLCLSENLSVMLSVKPLDVVPLALRETARSDHQHRLLEPLYDASLQHTSRTWRTGWSCRSRGLRAAATPFFEPSRAVPVCSNCPFLLQLVVDWRSVMNVVRDQLILAPLTIFISKLLCFKSWLIESSCYRKLPVLELPEDMTHIRALDLIVINY
jgi:hypothetical protein